MAKDPPKRRTGKTAKKGGTPADLSWRPAFLEAFAKTGIVLTACEVAKVGRSTAYAHRDRDEDFAKQWAVAEDAAADVLEQEAYRRAATGTEKAVFYMGKRVDGGEVREYSDTLLIFLMKARKPEKFREHFDHRVTGAGGGALQINIVPAKAPAPKADDGGGA